VYQDFNGNGVKDNSATFNEVGLSGVKVIATDPSGAALTVTYTGNRISTNTTGQYSVTGGTLGQVRLEFVMPDDYTFASKGGISGTSIMFPTAATQNLGVFYPGAYVSNKNPRVATQQYTNGNNQTIVFTIDADFTGSIRNVAKITGYRNEHGLLDKDSDPDRDGVKDDEIDESGIDEDDEDSNDFEGITVLPELVFDLALRKTMTAGSKTIFKTGDTVSFDITDFNQGTVAATSVDLVDYIPAGLTLQDLS
jgi:uncharacterized repeat protein (TIGR01451 family)